MTDFDANADLGPDLGPEVGRTSAVPPPPRPIEYTDADPSGWWLSLLLGLALIVVGLWLLTNLFESVTILAVLVGVSLIVGGIVEIIALGRHDGLGWPAWAGGGLVMALGLVVLAWPDITLQALAVVAGAALFVAGGLHIAMALLQRAGSSDGSADSGADRSGLLVELALGALGVLLGAMVMAWPDATLVVIAVVVGLRALLSGVVALGVGVQLWNLHRRNA